MADSTLELNFRPLQVEDIGHMPVSCQGTQEALRERTADIGAAAMLAFDDGRHVAQLQFRRYNRATRSPNSLWDPLYWGDFGDHAPALSENTLALFCYHVGQVDDTEHRESRYQGHGVGARLLEETIGWARKSGFSTVVAKASPSLRPVMAFMGGQSVEVYLEHGFRLVESWVDADLKQVVRDEALVPDQDVGDAASTVACCVLEL